MKKSAVHSRSGIFLMEIIIAILLFSLVSAVCLQAFTKAHNMSAESAEMNKAISLTTNMAELAQDLDSPEAVLAAGEGDVQNNRLVVGYNEDWEQCDMYDSSCVYLLMAEYNRVPDSPNLTSWDLAVIKKHGKPGTDSSQDDVIYGLTTEVYYGK